MVFRLGAWAAHSALGSMEVEGLKRVSRGSEDSNAVELYCGPL